MSIYYEDKGTIKKWIDGPNLLANAAHTATNWSAAVATDVLSYDKAAAAETTTFEGSFSRWLPQDEKIGVQLVSVTLYYTVGTAALTSAPTFELHKLSFNATTNVPTGTAVAMAGGDTLLKTVASHAIALKPTSTLNIKNGEAYNFEFVTVGAATSTIKVYGAMIEYIPAGQ